MKIQSNIDIFFDFLAKNFSTTKYILAYQKRYDSCVLPMIQTLTAKANKKPKGMFSEILGSAHPFKALERMWLDYVDKTINYEPKENDVVECVFFNENTYERHSATTRFASGNKYEFTDIGGTTYKNHILLKKIDC